MKVKAFVVFVLVVLLKWNCAAAEMSFAAYDLFIDPAGEELGGYQLRVEAGRGVKFAGVEGGDHAGYKTPPIYDSKAINKETIILAAIGSGRELPREKTRVATLHVQVSNEAIAQFKIKLLSSGSSGAKRIFPEVTIRKRGDE